jgi:hypothetical protein
MTYNNYRPKFINPGNIFDKMLTLIEEINR